MGYGNMNRHASVDYCIYVCCSCFDRFNAPCIVSVRVVLFDATSAGCNGVQVSVAVFLDVLHCCAADGVLERLTLLGSLEVVSGNSGMAS